MNRFVKTIFVLMVLMLSSLSLFAALSDYTFTTTQGTYTPITGGTEFTILSGTTYSDDQKFVSPLVLAGTTSSTATGVGLPIGFNFTFNESTFDVLGINANGWISFGQSSLGATAVNVGATSAYTCLSSTLAITPAQLTNRIAVLNRDLQAQAGSSLRMETIGTAPNRVCIVQWTAFKRYGTSGTGDNLNFQVKLYETSNNVEIVYGSNVIGATATATTITYQVGLRGPATTDYSARTTTTDWANTTLAAANNATCSLDATVYPAIGLTFKWAAPVAGTVPNPAALVSPTGTDITKSATLNWGSGGGMPTGYKLYFGTNNPPSNIVNGTDLLNTNTYDPNPDMNYNTTYYWKVVPYNSFGDAVNCPVWSFTTMPDPTISTLPYTQSFDDTTFPPASWTNVALSGTTLWTRSTSGSNPTCTPHSGAGMAYYNSYSATSGFEAKLTTPPINFGASAYRMKVWILHENSASYYAGDYLNERIDVLYGTTVIGSFARNDLTLSAPTWIQHEIALPVAAGGEIKDISFLAHSAFGDNMFMDDITIEEVPTEPLSSFNVTSKNFGTTATGTNYNTYNFVLTNTGQGTLVVDRDQIYFSGTNASEFILADLEYPIELEVNASFEIPVTFAPTSAGDKTALLKVESNGSNSPIGADLTGVAYAALTTLSENFDTVTTPALPTYWSAINTTGSTSSYVTTSTTGFSTPNQVTMYNSSITGSLALVSPAVNNLSSKRLRFYAKGGVGYNVIVGTLSNPTDPATFTEIQTIPITATYTQYNVIIPTTTNKYIAIKHALGAAYRYIYLDNVLIETPSNTVPNVVTLGTPNDARQLMAMPLLSWTPSDTGEPATGYKVYVSTNSSNFGTPVADIATTSYQTEGLVNGTTYYWKIVPYNTYGEQTTNTVRSFNFIPLTNLAENFENTTTPAGWQVDASTWASSTTTPFDGTRCFYVSTSTTAITTETAKKLITPLLMINSSSTLNFYTRTTATTGTQNIAIKYSQDGTTWTDAQVTTVPQTNWGNVVVSLSTLTPGNYYLAFGAFASASASIYLDYVIGPNMAPVLPNAVTQTAPADLATNVSVTPTLTWTPSATGGVPTGYKVYGGLSSTSLQLVTAVTTTSFTVPALNALPYSTTYYWQIVATNTTGDSQNNTIMSFTTMPDPTIYTLPYTQSFDDTTFPPFGWTNVAESGTGLWARSTSGSNPTCTPHSGAGMGYFNSYNISAGGIGNLTTPQIVFPSNGYRLRFWVMHEHSSSYNSGAYLNERIDAFYGTTLIGSFARYDSTLVAPTWIEHIMTLPINAGGQTQTISFKAYSQYGDNMFMDDITIEAIPVNPIFGISPSTVDFGTVVFNTTTEPQTFTVTNTGNGLLGINSIALSGTNADQFTLVNTNTLPVNIAAQETITFTVDFHPTSVGEKTATVTVTDALSRTAHDVTITGTGFDPTFTIPHVQNFDTNVTLPNLPLGFANYCSNAGTSDQRPWMTVDNVISNVEPNSAPNCAAVFYHSTLPKNAWMITPATVLTAGNTYRVKFMVIAPGYSGTPEKMSLYVGSTSTPQGMIDGSLLWDDANMLYATYTEKSATFVPTMTGSYYFAWHAYSDADVNYIAVDDISFELLSAPTNLTANVTGYNVALSWNAPARSMAVREAAITALRSKNVVRQSSDKRIYIAKNNDITSRSKRISQTQPLNNDRTLGGFNVYRNDVLIANVASDVVTYNDNSLAQGTYTYKVRAIYENDESSPITVQAVVPGFITQTFTLGSGWNMISANVVPSNLNMNTIFSPLQTNGTLISVVSQAGTFVRKLGSTWNNGIGNLVSTQGYRVRVNAPTSLQMQGQSVALPMTINLNSGWNIISYPYSIEQNPLTLLSSLTSTNKLVTVVSETGTFIRKLGSTWNNGIGNFKPGKAYAVRVNVACTLTYNPVGGTFIQGNTTSVRKTEASYLKD